MSKSCFRCTNSVSVGAVLGIGAVTYSLMVINANRHLGNAVEIQGVSLVDAEPTTEEKKMISKDVLGYEMEMLDGTMKKLGEYRGSVVLMVNVASECGLTPQYEGLEKLYREHKKEGLIILGFPVNDFGAQEPGTNEEIAQFCSGTFDVTFPMMGKIHVKGKEAHPLYKQLAEQPEPIGGEPEWNFAKFLINRKGEVVARFGSRTIPSDPGLVSKVAELLAED